MKRPDGTPLGTIRPFLLRSIVGEEIEVADGVDSSHCR